MPSVALACAQAVFRRFRGQLQQIYRVFSGGDRSMSSTEFFLLVRKCGMIDEAFTKQDLSTIFNRVQARRRAACAGPSRRALRHTARWRAP